MEKKSDVFVMASVIANAHCAHIIGRCARAYYEGHSMGKSYRAHVLEQALEDATELQAAISAALEAARDEADAETRAALKQEAA